MTSGGGNRRDCLKLNLWYTVGVKMGRPTPTGCPLEGLCKTLAPRKRSECLLFRLTIAPHLRLRNQLQNRSVEVLHTCFPDAAVVHETRSLHPVFVPEIHPLHLAFIPRIPLPNLSTKFVELAIFSCPVGSLFVAIVDIDLRPSDTAISQNFTAATGARITVSRLGVPVFHVLPADAPIEVGRDYLLWPLLFILP